VIERKGRGRPPKPKDQKRVPLSVLVSPVLREVLVAIAEAYGRSLTGMTEQLLDGAVRRELAWLPIARQWADRSGPSLERLETALAAVYADDAAWREERATAIAAALDRLSARAAHARRSGGALPDPEGADSATSPAQEEGAFWIGVAQTDGGAVLLLQPEIDGPVTRKIPLTISRAARLLDELLAAFGSGGADPLEEPGEAAPAPAEPRRGRSKG